MESHIDYLVLIITSAKTSWAVIVRDVHQDGTNSVLVLIFVQDEHLVGNADRQMPLPYSPRFAVSRCETPPLSYVSSRGRRMLRRDELVSWCYHTAESSWAFTSNIFILGDLTQ